MYITSSFKNAGSTCYIDSLLNAMFAQSTAFDYLLLPLINPTPPLALLQESLKTIVNLIRNYELVKASVVVDFVDAMRQNNMDFSADIQHDSG